MGPIEPHISSPAIKDGSSQYRGILRVNDNAGKEDLSCGNPKKENRGSKAGSEIIKQKICVKSFQTHNNA